MIYATCKPIEVSTPHATLTPCIFDDDAAERGLLTTLIIDMGYEPVASGDAEEALRLVRLGRCRMIFS